MREQDKCYLFKTNPLYAICMFITIMTLFLLTACSSLNTYPPYQHTYTSENDTPPDPQPPERQAPDEPFPDDGILRLSMRHPLTLNPLLNEDATVAPILRLLFEPLVILDENLQPTGHLAHMDLASDFASATLTIRNDALWGDGMPVTADDLIFSVEVLRLAPDAVIYKRNVENIARVDRIDTRTVLITFERASITAAYSLNFPIIPRHYYQGHVNTRSPLNMAPLGNGPYRFESVTPMQSMTLERNPYTFRRAHIEQIDVLFIPDAITKLHAFDQGVVDAIRLPFAEWMKHHSVKPVNHEEFPAMYFEFIGFNFQREIFQDERTRQGIAHAFNTEEAMSAVYLHQAVRAVSPIHPHSWMHDDTITGPVYSPSLATQILRAVRPPEPLEILVNTEHIERVHIAERLSASLGTAGLPAKVVELPFDKYYNRLMYGDFDLFLGFMQLDFVPNFAFMFQEGPLFGLDPVMEGLFASLSIASTESAYLQAVSQLQQGFVDRLPIISLGFRHSAVLTGTRVEQGRAPASDNVFAFANEWRIR